jgi:hypothetical protein
MFTRTTRNVHEIKLEHLFDIFIVVGQIRNKILISLLVHVI